MKAWALAVGVLVLLVLAWLFLRRRAGTAGVGSQYVTPPLGAPPSQSSNDDERGVTGFLTSVFANKFIGDTICRYYTGGKAPAACSLVYSESKKVTAAQINIAKGGLGAAATGVTAPIKGTIAAARDLASGNVSGAGRAVASSAVAAPKAVAHAAAGAVHAVENLF